MEDHAPLESAMDRSLGLGERHGRHPNGYLVDPFLQGVID
jgi:hypothetical protein